MVYSKKGNKEIYIPGISKYLKNTPMGVASRTQIHRASRPNVSGVIHEVRRRNMRRRLLPNTFRYNIGLYGANYSNVFHLSPRQYIIFVNMIRNRLKKGNVTSTNAQNIARSIIFAPKYK